MLQLAPSAFSECWLHEHNHDESQKGHCHPARLLSHFPILTSTSSFPTRRDLLFFCICNKNKGSNFLTNCENRKNKPQPWFPNFYKVLWAFKRTERCASCLPEISLSLSPSHWKTTPQIRHYCFIHRWEWGGLEAIQLEGEELGIQSPALHALSHCSPYPMTERPDRVKWGERPDGRYAWLPHPDASGKVTGRAHGSPFLICSCPRASSAGKPAFPEGLFHIRYSKI